MRASKVRSGTASGHVANDGLGPAGARPLVTSRAAAMRPGARALPEHTRSHNRALVLQALYRGEGLSRADLAREVGLTRVTISDLVSELIEEDLAVELGRRPDVRPGKPATLLDINRSGFAIIGLDLSLNSAFHGAVTDLDGTILHRAHVDTTGVTGDQAVVAVTTLLDKLVASAGAPVLGIGVGSPGVVNAEGKVLSAPNLGWSDVPLQDIIRDHTGLPVQVANDANTAALAERTFGGSQGDTMLVRIGRGVGSGVVISGAPVYGSNFAAGEIGHVVVGTDGGDRCACGKDGCLETWLATPRLEAKLANASSQAQKETILREAGQRLGIALAPIVGALNLGEVVLSGPLELLDGTLLEGTAETLRDRTMADFHGDLTLRMTTLGGDIVVLGAVVMVLTGQLGVS
jgi:predicted NBD/HSP70 family sugar kinase